MKQLTFVQHNPQMGKIEIVLRIIGKLFYFKFNDNQYSQQIINQLQSKGAEIRKGKGWIEVNIFKNRTNVKLGEKEFDVNETSDEETEVILSDFYKFQYKKAGFKLKEEKDE